MKCYSTHEIPKGRSQLLRWNLSATLGEPCYICGVVLEEFYRKIRAILEQTGHKKGPHTLVGRELQGGVSFRNLREHSFGIMLEPLLILKSFD